MVTRVIVLTVSLLLSLPGWAQIRNDAAMAIEAMGPVSVVPGPGLDGQSIGVAVGGGLPIQIVTIRQTEKGIGLGTPIGIQGDTRRRGFLPFAPSPDVAEVMFEIGQLRIAAKPEGSFHRDLGAGLNQVTATMRGLVIEDRGAGPNWKGVQVLFNVTCEGERASAGKTRCAIGIKFRSPTRTRTVARNTVLLEALSGPVRDPGLVPVGNLEAGTHTLVLPADTPVLGLPRGLVKDIFVAQPIAFSLPPGVSHAVLPIATQDVLLPSISLHVGSLALSFTSSELVTMTPTAIGKTGELNLRLLGKVESDFSEDADNWKGLPSTVTINCRQSGPAAPLTCELGVTVATPP